MKKILGLDLGSSSIGWALIAYDNDKAVDIIGMGCRIVPLSVEEKEEFEKGNGESINQQRTTKRTQRKGFDRYQLRREKLKDILNQNSMLPNNETLIGISPLQLYGLRAKAISEKISLTELGRVLLLINQKRGYKSARKDESGDKKDTEYVKTVKNRFEQIKTENLTIGQWLYKNLKIDNHFRIKNLIFPREAYIDEFNAIWMQQEKHYPDVLTIDLQKSIRNEIIFYQRPLKSQKGLVSICEFEGKYYLDKRDDHQGKLHFSGAKVAPRSSPLAQLCAIWETVNNIRIGVKRTKKNVAPSLILYDNGYATPTLEYKQRIVEALCLNEKLSKSALFKILSISESDGYISNEQLNSGLPGNKTLYAIAKILNNNPNKEKLLQLNLVNLNYQWTNKETGEIIDRKYISEQIEHEPLYQLWHCIYSIDDASCLINKLLSIGVNEDEAIALSKLDFTKDGFSNRSTKAIRKILPYLQQGYGYSDACLFAGYNHSNSITKEENKNRITVNKLALLAKNSLRQPVVEKILNQLVNLVNLLIDEYGKPDEIRIELARELKQSKEERSKASQKNRQREKENANFAKKAEGYGRASKRNIQKMRMYEEVDGFCLYCGKKLEIAEFIQGIEADIEHIIPRSVYYDDSQQNKIPSHRACNSAKGNNTAYDYMIMQSADEFNRYEEFVNKLYNERKITKAKRDKLFMKATELPEGFVNRQINETRYISRKSVELLKQICTNVFCSTGMVTERLRHLWGWNEVLANTHFDKYKVAGLTVIKEFTDNNQKHTKEIIENWSKRDDHRHHAIDALTVACTKQGFIQRWNTLSSQQTQYELQEVIKGLKFNTKLTLLEKYFINERPFTTEKVQQHADAILISQKAGKKVASFGVRKIKKNGKTKVVQKGIIIPRGALSEESVYGKIQVKEHNVPIKKLFENPESIFKPKIKKLIKARLAEYDNDVKEALASLKKQPIYLDQNNAVELTYGTVLRDEYVIRKPLESLDEKQVEKIVDSKIKHLVKVRLAEYGGIAKEAFKDLANNPIWLNKEKGIAIKTVRTTTGLSAIVPLKCNNDGKPISFVKPGNNHHIAIYKDKNGNLQEHIVTFWQAVERKKYNIPVVITDTNAVWNEVLNKPEHYYPTQLLQTLPIDGWEYVTSMQQNEMFIFGLPKEEIKTAIEYKNTTLISKHLYRVQKISTKEYVFRHHLETRVDDKKTIGELIAKKIGKVIIIQSLKNMVGIKVTVNRLGQLFLNN